MPCKSANGIAAKLFMSTPSASQRSTWVLCDANVSPSQIRSNSGAKVTTIKVIGYRPRKTARIPVRKRSSTLARSIVDAVANAGNKTAAIAPGRIKSLVTASNGVA